MDTAALVAADPVFQRLVREKLASDQKAAQERHAVALAELGYCPDARERPWARPPCQICGMNPPGWKEWTLAQDGDFKKIRLAAAARFLAARRLPWYRRLFTRMPSPEQVVAAVDALRDVGQESAIFRLSIWAPGGKPPPLGRFP